MSKIVVSHVAGTSAEVGEGAVWDVLEQVLYWVDIPKGLVHRHDPATGDDRRWAIGEPVGCLAVREVGGLVLALQSGFWLFDPETGERTAIGDPEADLPDNRFNDGATDPAGRFWAGTMKSGNPPEAIGAFYRLDPDHHIKRWRGGIYTTNGLAFAPDGRTMYFSDSNPEVRTIWSAAYDLDRGEPGEPKPFFDTREVAGRPDGGTVDADGCYWMAGVSGWQLVRITPEGKVDRIVEMPIERPSKPMFGGQDLDILFVTSIGVGLTPGSGARQPEAGGLFTVQGLGVRGVAQARFAG